MTDQIRILFFYALSVGLCQMALCETVTIAKITDGVPVENIGPINPLTGQYDGIALPFGFSLHAGDIPGRSIVEPSSYPNGYYKKKVGSRVVQTLAHSLDLFIKGPIDSGTGSYQLIMRAAPSYRVIDFILQGGKYVPKIIGATNIREFRPVSIGTSWVYRLFFIGINDRSYIEFEAFGREGFRLRKIVSDTLVTTIGYDSSWRLYTITDAYGNVTTFKYVTGGFDVLYASKKYRFRFGTYGLATVDADISSTSTPNPVSLFKLGYPTTTTAGSCKGLLSYIEFAKTLARLNLVYKSCATSADLSPLDLTVTSFYPSEGATKNGAGVTISYLSGTEVGYSHYGGSARWTYEKPPASSLIRLKRFKDGINTTDYTYDVPLSYLPQNITVAVYPVTAPISPLPRSSSYNYSIARNEFGQPTQTKAGSRITGVFQYNSQGQLTFSDDKLGRALSIDYNPQGQPYRIKTGGAVPFDIFDLSYNNEGFVSTIKQNNVLIQTRAYDLSRPLLGLVTSVTDENGKTTKFSYGDPSGTNAWPSPFKLALKSVTKTNGDIVESAKPNVTASGNSFTMSQFFSNGTTSTNQTHSEDMAWIMAQQTHTWGPKITQSLSTAASAPRVTLENKPGDLNTWTDKNYTLKAVTINGVADTKDFVSQTYFNSSTNWLDEFWNKTSHLSGQPIP